MSIHQAKGLEFPVVFLPNLHHRTMRPQEHWFALDRQLGLTVKIPDGRGKQVAGLALERFRERAKRREYAEGIRVLYVAATRAEDRLILSGVTDTLDKLEGATDNWLKLIWQKLELQVSKSGLIQLGDEAELAVVLNLAEQEKTPGTSLANLETEPAEVPGSVITAFPLLAPITGEPSGTDRFSVTQLINYQRCPRQYYFDRILHVPSADEMAVWNNAEAPEPPANLTATMKGAVIHRFCEAYQTGDNAEARLRQSFTEIINSRRSQLSDRLVDIKIDEALAELWPLAQNYLCSSVFQRIEEVRKICGEVRRGAPSAKPGIWSELSFRLRRPAGFITGTIDKLLLLPSLHESGLRVEIIDFKTNRLTMQKSVQVVEMQPASPLQRRRRSKKSKQEAASQFVFDFSASLRSQRAPHPSTEDVGDVSKQVAALAADYQLQMQAYALAVRQLLPWIASPNSVKATLHFLQPNIEHQLADELLDSTVCEQSLNDAMLRVVQSVKPEEFPVMPAVHCRNCNFLDACYAGRQWLRNNSRSRLRAQSNQNL
jgi:ATP-dependent exoDNAse (exonuclease V) beta subunit